MAVGRNGVEEGEVDDDDDDDDDRPWLGLLEKQSSFLPSFLPGQRLAGY